MNTETRLKRIEETMDKVVKQTDRILAEVQSIKKAGRRATDEPLIKSRG